MIAFKADVTINHPTLYNVDSKGRTRIWYIQQSGNKYRTIAGLKDGKQVTSEWTECFGKNTGKVNQTSDGQQCDIEIDALYKKKTDKKYHTEEATVGGFKFFEPMLARKWSDRKDKVKFPVYSQPKLDGYRCILTNDQGLSRGGKVFQTIPHIHAALAPLFGKNPNLRLDGELYNHKLHDDFNRIGSLIKKQKPSKFDLDQSEQFVQYWIYDVPSCSGTFSNRLNYFRNIFVDLDQSIFVKFVPTRLVYSQEELDDHYAQLLEYNFEGQMIRTDDLPYKSGRSDQLLKRKEFFDEEFEVVSLEQGKGNWSGHAKAVYFKMPDGRLTKSGENPRAGIRGSQEFTKQLLEGPLPKTVTVRYPNKTPDGLPRFPIAVEFQNEEGRVY